jgi:RNA polymerase sigma factor (sigma-70 family)
LILDDIILAKQGDSRAIEHLVDKFSPLIKKYGRKLLQEDGYNEMVLAFLELINKIEPDKLHRTSDDALVTYIAQSMRNSYLYLQGKFFKRPQESFSLDDATEQQKLDFSVYLDVQEEQAFLDLLRLCPSLTENERFVLKMVYYQGYSCADIARKMSTSKQNINQIKQRALKKMKKGLKRYYEE